MVKSRAVLARRTRIERQQDRRPLGSLKSRVVGIRTYVRYCTQFNNFNEFLRANNHETYSYEELDRLMVEFLEMFWHSGDPRTYGSYAIAGLKHFIPAAARRLLQSERIAQAWKRAELPARASPLTPQMVGGICGMFVLMDLPGLGALAYLAFHCLLRTGEMFLLQRRHVTFNESRTRAVLALPVTKMSQRHGEKEAVTVDDPEVVRHLALLCQSKCPGDFLAPCSMGTFRKRFADAVAALGLSEFYILPYSLRRGGPRGISARTDQWSGHASGAAGPPPVRPGCTSWMAWPRCILLVFLRRL